VYETILSGDLNGNDVDVPDPCDLLDEPTRAENSYHVVTGSLSDETAVLDGFTITAGNADGAYLNNSGGGMFNSEGNPSFVNCTFESNSAVSLGGGFYNDSSANPKLLSCTFTRNSAGFLGGGIDVMGQATLINCIFINNFAGQAGGAINSVFSDRTILTSCYFIANSAGSNGGAAYFREAFDAILTNCIFVSNSAHNRGGGIYAHINSVHCEVINSIFWDNSNDQIFGAPYVSYSDVQDGWQGEGNIDADPVFADPNNGDYHLKSQAGRYDPNPPAADWVRDEVTSPCIDAGDPNSSIGQEPFPNGGIVNMGVYGGTAEASKSYFGEPVCEIIVAGDINGDCKVDFKDFALMAVHWLESVEQVICADNQDSP
jgi:predicted outer membrane repeat protein